MDGNQEITIAQHVCTTKPYNYVGNMTLHRLHMCVRACPHTISGNTSYGHLGEWWLAVEGACLLLIGQPL